MARSVDDESQHRDGWLVDVVGKCFHLEVREREVAGNRSACTEGVPKQDLNSVPFTSERSQCFNP